MFLNFFERQYLTSKESGGPWPSKNATRDGQVAFVWATAQNLSVHGAKMTNFRPTHSKKRTLFKMKEMPPFSLHKIIFPRANIGVYVNYVSFGQSSGVGGVKKMKDSVWGKIMTHHSKIINSKRKKHKNCLANIITKNTHNTHIYNTQT